MRALLLPLIITANCGASKERLAEAGAELKSASDPKRTSVSLPPYRRRHSAFDLVWTFAAYERLATPVTGWRIRRNALASLRC